MQAGENEDISCNQQKPLIWTCVSKLGCLQTNVFFFFKEGERITDSGCFLLGGVVSAWILNLYVRDTVDGRKPKQPDMDNKSL